MAHATQPGAALDLEKELSCSICTDVLYQPLTLLDCLHTFCGSCLKEWFSWQVTSANHNSRHASPYTCPSCRAIVRAARPNANVTTLLDMFLHANPGSGKTEQEKAEMRAHYTPGDNVIPPVEVQGDADDIEDERLLEDVMQMSVADLNPGVEANRRALRGHRHQEGDPSRDRRRRDVAEARRRQDAVSRDVTHQPSIRSLLSASELNPAAVKEVYDQIMASAAFDGVDTDNLTAAQEEALIERIAEAYRRQHGSHNREDRSSDTSDRTSTTTRPTDVSSRPHLSEQWGRDAMQPSRRSDERRRESPIRQPTAAVASRMPPTARTISDPVPRDDEGLDRRRRVASPRSNTDTFAATITSQTHDHDLRPRRAETGTQLPTFGTAPHVMANVTSNARYAAVTSAAQPDVITSPPTSTPPTIQTSTLPYPTTSYAPALPNAANTYTASSLSSIAMPGISCSSCARTDIQHDLHYACRTCDQGAYTLCLPCYRAGKGCKYWFGFGYAAGGRWRQSSPQVGADHPHILSPRRYTRTAPTQLLTGAFCEICFEHADDEKYWHCTSCLDGAWGYCTRCIQQARHCTHPLTPVARAKTDDDIRKVTTGILRPVPLPHLAEGTYFFQPPSIKCAICAVHIPGNHTRIHCPQCHHGNYDICNDSYRSLEATGKVSPEHGLRGTRQCLQGHPTSIVAYRDLTDKLQQRVIVTEAIGGYDAKHAVSHINPTSNLRCLALWSWWPAEGVDDELSFPKWAEIREVEKINADYYLGVYADSRGLFPANHVKLL